MEILERDRESIICPRSVRLLTKTISVRPSFRRVLSNRPFSLLSVGQLVSQSGDFIFDVAAIWYVLQLTGDPFKVGLAVATILLPAIFIGPIASVYLDRFNRRDVMLASNIVQSAVAGMIGTLYSLSSLSFLALLVMLFLLNSGAQFVRPAVQTSFLESPKRGSLYCQQPILA